ncbi:MAG: GNAT family N-acetyltransferase [Roseburia sp.]
MRKGENKHMCIAGDVRNPSQSGILEGICKGECWISDDRMLGVTYSYPVGGCGVFGKIESNEKAKIFFDKVFCNLKALDIHEFEFSTEDAALQEQLLYLFQNRKIEHELEYSYEINENTDVEIDVPSGYRVEPVTEQTLHKRYENEVMLIKRLEECWNSLEDFLEKSLSFIAVKDKEIVGIIFGSARYEKYIPIDIEVLKEHRKKGVAKALTVAFVKHCMKCDLVPHWDCVESNEGSIHLAESAGFKKIKERPFYWFDII